MRYVFSEELITLSRIDDRTAKQKRIAKERRQKKNDSLAEYLSSEQMFERLNRKPKPLNYGIEVWLRTCTLRDWQGEWYEVKLPTLALCLPRMERLSKVERLNPGFWEDSQAFYWRFKQKGHVALYCVHKS